LTEKITRPNPALSLQKSLKKNSFGEKLRVTIQAITEQDQAEKEKRDTIKTKLDFSEGFVCLFVGGVCFFCCCRDVFKGEKK